LRIARSLLDELVAHALEDAPNECCGLISARDGEAVAVHRIRNSKASPFAYELEPMEQLSVETQIADDGLDVAAIYHSHTRSDPEPSQTDRNLANPLYAHVLYVIVGVKDRSAPEVRAWRILPGDVFEVPLKVL
jgi:proteasome lid subunit RPN8/RPN11